MFIKQNLQITLLIDPLGLYTVYCTTWQHIYLQSKICAKNTHSGSYYTHSPLIKSQVRPNTQHNFVVIDNRKKKKIPRKIRQVLSNAKLINAKLNNCIFLRGCIGFSRLPNTAFNSSHQHAAHLASDTNCSKTKEGILLTLGRDKVQPKRETCHDIQKNFSTTNLPERKSFHACDTNS